MRKFQPVKKENLQYNTYEVKLPERATKHSAGYDIYSPINIVIKPQKSEIIWTNVKAEFNTDEVLMLFVTSKMGKNHIILANGTGIIESDYFNNESNDGNLGLRLLNLGNDDYIIKRGDKIGQGVFLKFLTVDDEPKIDTIRKGGFGSTGGN